MELLIAQGHLPLFDSGHVQNIIDQRQKLPAGKVDFFCISRDFFRLL